MGEELSSLAIVSIRCEVSQHREIDARIPRIFANFMWLELAKFAAHGLALWRQNCFTLRDA